MKIKDFMGRLFSFRRPFRLFGQKESRVLQLFTQHLDLVIKVVNNLKSLVSLATRENNVAAILEAKIGVISDHESLADDAHLKALIEISEGAFFSGLREDFIKLFESIDDIADFAKDASEILGRSKLYYAVKKFCEEPEASLVLFVERIAKAVEVLKEGIDYLEKDVNLVVKKCIEVKTWEEAADEIESKLIETIFSYKSDMDVLTLLELKELVLTLDEIADAAWRSSEILVAIVAKART